MCVFSPELDVLIAVAIADIDDTGHLLQANAGFRHLIALDESIDSGTLVDAYFIQPTFSHLIKAQAVNDAPVYQGLLTLGDYSGLTRTLNTRIWRRPQGLRVVAEYDIASLERLNDQVLELNRDYAISQFELTQTNITLKQREQALQQSLTELKTTQKQLVEAEKMAALGMMVAGVAHEINTPLGISLGSASLLTQQTQTLQHRFSERCMTQSDLKNYLEQALQETTLLHANLERIGRLTDSFRQIAVDGRQIKKSRFNLYHCLKDVLTSLGTPLKEQHVDVRVSCAHDLEIDSYASEWASIFTNLLNNSLEHGFKGRDRGHIDISIQPHENQLSMAYRDDGVGLSAHVQTRIFEPFFTTNLQQGMGLGMHLIYNVVTQQMQGHIHCESPEGQGIRITIEVPL